MVNLALYRFQAEVEGVVTEAAGLDLAGNVRSGVDAPGAGLQWGKHQHTVGR